MLEWNCKSLGKRCSTAQKSVLKIVHFVSLTPNEKSAMTRHSSHSAGSPCARDVFKRREFTMKSGLKIHVYWVGCSY